LILVYLATGRESTVGNFTAKKHLVSREAICRQIKPPPKKQRIFSSKLPVIDYSSKKPGN
jgi:hypothetical protein